jgi:hypothetical protein
MPSEGNAHVWTILRARSARLKCNENNRFYDVPTLSGTVLSDAGGGIDLSRRERPSVKLTASE